MTPSGASYTKPWDATTPIQTVGGIGKYALLSGNCFSAI